MRKLVTSTPRFFTTRSFALHEYASKKLLREFGCETDHGIMCQTLNEVRDACAKIPGDRVVVKSQILAGGRGKGYFADGGMQGGVHLCNNTEEALEKASGMLGKNLITKQTGPGGLPVSKLLVTEEVPDIRSEIYVGLTLDRQLFAPTFIVCTEGGTSIEELARERPDMIHKFPVDILRGLSKEEARTFTATLGLEPEPTEALAEQLVGLYNLAKAKDATLVEINPMAELHDGRVLCLDAKLSFDLAASFRHPEFISQKDTTQQDPREMRASELDINYVGLEGNVGCLVNGAGLAMATMDLCHYYGASPANFLDCGGSASKEQMEGALELISEDKHVTVIFVNIFGGILRCDDLAHSIKHALEVHREAINQPMVIRLRGNHEKEAKEILRASGFKLHIVDELAEAGELVCKLTKECS